ncbi:phosphosulfolactate synthase [Desulfobacter vibrioformis]|uniref:phosphosulfolactate synthase n=1 Tax=Desulfobacter vibrioformis TaxID=34031 RepID=UPI00055290FA|nr:phosphosulfolactate synthase [Desulfobacter vibrioformis]
MRKSIDVPERAAKPRTKGITAITDVGIPAGELPLILESYHSFVDIAKLGLGTAFLEPFLAEKIACYNRFGIPVYFGGTLFEKHYIQGRITAYLDLLRHYGICHIEISCGTISLESQRIVEMIHQFKNEFTVLVEVGKKAQDPSFTKERWIKEASAAMDAGCDFVILEGRNTADAGIYDSHGNLDEDLINTLIQTVEPDHLIFEAATARSQAKLINLLGANVNLGNIFARDLLLLETQRAGLREETFFVS